MADIIPIAFLRDGYGNIMGEKEFQVGDYIDPAFIHGVTGGGVTIHNDLTGRTVADGHPATAITNAPAGPISATNVQDAIDQLASLAGITVHNSLSGRTAAAVHPASSITNTPSGPVTSTTVQDAINELALIAGVTVHNSLSGRTAAAAHPATSITNTPYGPVTSTTVQDAINELALVAGATVHNNLSGRTAAAAHPASSITNTPYGPITSTTVQDAINELVLVAGITVHNSLSGRTTAAAHPATSITNTPAGTIVSTVLQDAINELDSDMTLLRNVGVDTFFTTGFVNRTTSTISISTRTVTVAPTATSFDIYTSNVKITKTGGASCQTTIPDTVGFHFIYFDSSGNLQNSMSAWSIISGTVPVATIFWNGSAAAISDERHAAGRDLRWHLWAHDTIGARYESGLVLTYPSVGTPDKLQVESGVIHDEDIEFSISQQKVCRNFYETAASTWTWANGTDNAGNDRPYIWNGGTSRVQYPKSDSAYALTDVGAAAYIAVWVYGTTDLSRPIYIITPSATGTYASVAAARAATPPVTTGLLTPELKLLFRLIIKGDGAFQESVDYRSSSPLPGGGSSTVNAISVNYTPTSPLTSTNVQGALDQLAGMGSGTTGSAVQKANGAGGLTGITNGDGWVGNFNLPVSATMAPSSGLNLGVSNMAYSPVPRMVDPGGRVRYFQEDFLRDGYGYLRVGWGSTLTYRLMGWGGTPVTTAAADASSTSSPTEALRRMPSVRMVTTSSAGSLIYFRGNTSDAQYCFHMRSGGIGKWRFRMVFAPWGGTASISDARGFWGVRTSSSNPTNVAATTLLSAMGIGMVEGSANLHAIHADGSTNVADDLGSSFPSQDLNQRVWYLLELEGPEDGHVYGSLTNLYTGVTSPIWDWSTNLPNSYLTLWMYITNNGSAAVATSAFYGAEWWSYA